MKVLKETEDKQMKERPEDKHNKEQLVKDTLMKEQAMDKIIIFNMSNLK